MTMMSGDDPAEVYMQKHRLPRDARGNDPKNNPTMQPHSTMNAADTAKSMTGPSQREHASAPNDLTPVSGSSQPGMSADGDEGSVSMNAKAGGSNLGRINNRPRAEIGSSTQVERGGNAPRGATGSGGGKITGNVTPGFRAPIMGPGDYGRSGAPQSGPRGGGYGNANVTAGRNANAGSNIPRSGKNA